MKRIDKAFHVLTDKARCQIIPFYCPYNIDPTLPDVDGNSYKEETSCCQQGCRGITCEECWDTQLPERPARTDWANATEEDVSEMTIGEAIFIAKSLCVNASENHVTKALQMIIDEVDKHRR